MVLFASLGILDSGTGALCLGDLEVGQCKIEEGGGEEKFGSRKVGRGKRAVVQWPVASLHPLPGLGSSSSVLDRENLSA